PWRRADRSRTEGSPAKPLELQSTRSVANELINHSILPQLTPRPRAPDGPRTHAWRAAGRDTRLDSERVRGRIAGPPVLSVVRRTPTTLRQRRIQRLFSG